MNKEVFYDKWACEVVVFKVENRLFSVLKEGLMPPGSAFADMFSIPSTTRAEGRPENPIVLGDTKASDFAAFLSVVYPWLGGSISKEKAIKQGATTSSASVALSESQWLGVLALANKWNFTDVRKEAIASLNSTLPLDGRKIELGRDYQVENWVKDGYYELAGRHDLTIHELVAEPNSFDQAAIAKIFYVRSESLAHYSQTYCIGRHCAYGKHIAECIQERGRLKDADELIATVFKEEIAEAYYNEDVA